MRVTAIAKKMIIFNGLILAAAMAFFVSWRWYQTLYAEVNPRLWQQTVIEYGTGQHQTLWLNRRHATKLRVAAACLQINEGREIPVQLLSVSYPALYPSAIRVDFELIDPADKYSLSNQQQVVIRQRR
ncbi:hypothetical protein WG68_07935 [Arsukibacterium ikkense]|uniref:Uncharacterized protein n=1 Tax=Arsukibacterium ikkense TaxID=336831 RepID=A0A0M2V5L7_9GAMM|nr:hypothetical protein [Arsukibacterium ikkense]KKO45931.1 hypothetical protein WG68_07935 [Arsukibacterium ikkense]